MPTPIPTVFFLSDYGTQDEFVGVVHAVLHAGCPGLTIIDLTHEIPAFDVRAGANALARAAPHLGPGVVLAVVDPEVGSDRRGLCLEVTPAGQGGPSYFVGPDNGLLVGAAEQVGQAPVARAFALTPAGTGSRSATFDGRDLFAPVAAALCAGRRPEEVGDPIDPESLVRLPRREPTFARSEGGRRTMTVEVTWVDRFGNVQLAATAADAEAGDLPRRGLLGLITTPSSPETAVRRVRTFADLSPGELGLLTDGNGHLAVVAGEASAAGALDLDAGVSVVLTW
jgi:hypothetical protein